MPHDVKQTPNFYNEIMSVMTFSVITNLMSGAGLLLYGWSDNTETFFSKWTIYTQILFAAN